MGDDVLNNVPVLNWRSLGSSLKVEYDLQLGSRLGVWGSECETKPFIPNAPPGFALNTNAGLNSDPFYNNTQAIRREYGFNGAPWIPTDYAKDYWVCERDQRARFPIMFSSGNAGNGVMPELASGSRNMQMVRPMKSEIAIGVMDESVIPETRLEAVRSQDNAEGELHKKRKSRKEPYVTMRNGGVTKRVKKQPTKSVDVVVNGIIMDISRIPTPVCSCTGTPLQCYRWGSGGWQSACCTIMLSEYPLPMSTNPKRPGTRIAGRKMSLGAFKKVLEKIASEGHDFSNAIDLKTHWARHGTNKYMTFR